MSPEMEGTKTSLTRGDVRRSFWLWTFFSHANYNYERLQGTAFARPALGWSDTAGFDGKVVGGHENNTNDRAILQEFQDQTSNLLDRRAKKRVF